MPSKENNESEGEEKKKWYPGKFLSKATSSHDKQEKEKEKEKLAEYENKGKDSEQEGEDKKWYPGKYVGKMRRSSNYSAESIPRPSSVELDFDKIYSFQDSVSHSIAHVDATPTAPHTTYLSGNLENAKAIATVEVKIHSIKYLTLQNPKITIELDGIASTFTYLESHLPIEKSFAVLDITSDIRIEFRGYNEKGLPAFGVIIIPLVSLLNFVGSPLPPSPAWRVIYPWYDNLKNLKKNVKFRSGFADIPGSAMAKPSPYLGFVQAEFSLVTPTKSALPLYFLPSPNPKSAAQYEEELEGGSELALAFHQARLTRDWERLKSVVFATPALISTFLSVPEIFIPIGLIAFVAHGIGVTQLPLFVWLLCLVNGLLTSSNRGSKAANTVTIWNDPGVTLSASSAITSSSISTGSTIASTSDDGASAGAGGSIPPIGFVKVALQLQVRLAEVTHHLEVLHHLFTFADSRVSVVVYALLFALMSLATIFLMFFSFTSLFVLVSSLILFVMASVGATDFLDEQISGLSTNSVYLPTIQRFRTYVMYAKILWSKVPDSLELTHRYICSTAIVKSTGGEMHDAKTYFESKAAANSEKIASPPPVPSSPAATVPGATATALPVSPEK